MTQSNRSQFDGSLATLNDNILKLASLVEEAVEQAMHALANRDLRLAQDVIVGDERINQLRYDLEQDSLRLLATQAPTASDLRHIIAVIHIATELERIGDHASGIARLVDRMMGEEELDTLYQLPKMTKRVLKMIRQSVQSFIARDAEMAATVIEKDVKVDRQYSKFATAVMADLADESSGVTLPTYMLWIGHNIERIGDRVTNIAERVIFMMTGKFVELDG